MYRRTMPNLDDHRLRIRSVLETSGASVRSGFSNVVWHIEDVLSRVYALSLLLVFVDRRHPMDELVVVAVNLRLDPAQRWTIDATGQFGIFIAEEAGLSGPDHDKMVADAPAAAAKVEAFLAQSEQLFIEVLSKGSTGDAPAH
jgi:hypothetical protein